MRKSGKLLLLLGLLMLIPMISNAHNPIPIDAYAYAGPDDDVCEGSSYTPWLATASDYTSLLWTSSGTGSFDDPTILYATYTPGIGELGPVVLTLTAYALPPANDDSDDMILTILDAPEASFTISPNSTLCQNEIMSFSGSSTTAITVWEWDFGDGNIAFFQNVMHTYLFAGTYNVSLIVTNTDGCKDTVIQTVSINELPICDFTTSPIDTAFVSSSILFSGSGTTAIVSWDWDFDDGNTASGQQVNHSYFTVGIYSVRLVVTNINGCTDTTIHSLVVIDPQIDFIMNPSPSCEAYQVSFTGIGGTGPGDYTWDFGDGNTATGQNVFHTYSIAGTYLVTLNYASEQIQKNLEVVAPPFADAGADDWMCGDVAYTLSGSALNYSSLMWESSGDGGFDDPTLLYASYSAGIADIAAGTVTLSLVTYANVPCPNDTSLIILSIQAAPISNAGADTASCDGAAVSLYGFVSNEDSHSWSTAGDGSFDDPGLVNATYTPGTNDLSNGSVILTLTAFAILPCDSDSADDLLLSLPLQPICNAGDDDQMCNNNPYTLNGTASDYASTLWSSSGDGSFDDPELLNAAYTPGVDDISNGSVTLTLTAIANEPCSDIADDMILSIQSPPMANAGDDAGICEGETSTLSGSASDYTSISWSTDGDGSFDDPNILTPVYTPGAGDIGNGGASLSLTATAISPCTINTTDAISLGIDPAVGNAATPQGPEMIDSFVTPSTEYQTQSTPEADEYKWTIFPSTAGDITGTGLTGLVIWEPSYQGLANIKVIAFNSCNSNTSDSLEVNVTTSVGLSHLDENKPQIIIIPNPNNGSFVIKASGLRSVSDIRLLDHMGREIMEIASRQSLSFEKRMDLPHLPRGLYFISVQSKNEFHSEKLIIQ